MKEKEETKKEDNTMEEETNEKEDAMGDGRDEVIGG